MLALEILPKILYKPREAYESMKGNVYWQEGLIVYFLCSVLSLIIFMGASSTLGVNMIPLDFGFGSVVSAYSLVFSFVFGLVLFVVIAALSNTFALKLGGEGGFSELFGMFGYSNVLNILQSIVSVILLGAVAFRITAISVSAMEGNLGVADLVGPIPLISLIFSLFFFAWLFWILGSAISVTHNISLVKGIAAVLISYIIIDLVSYGITFAFT